MPFISISFNEPINVSCQPGDNVYSTSISSASSVSLLQVGQLSGSYLIGTVYQLVNADGLDSSIPIQIVVETPNSGATIPTGEFLMFSKNKLANTSGITGYYAEVEFVNNSKKAKKKKCFI